MNARAQIDMAAADDGALDLRALGRAIAARRWWILGPTLAAFLAMLVYVTLAKPRYTAETKILLENQESYYTRPDKSDRDPGAPDQEAVQSQVQLITSRDLARQAIRRLELAGKPEFDPLAAGFDPLLRLMVLLGMQRDPTTLSPEDRVLEAWYDRLKVFPAPRTRVIVVEFTARDPDLAARAANVVAELYIGLRSSAKKEDARSAGQWLSGAVDDLRAKVASAEARVEEFRARNGLLVGANNTTINAQQLAELNTQLSNARSAQSEAQAKARLIRELLRQGRIFEIPDVAKDELIRRIAEQRVTLRAQLALESRTLLGGHPRIKELQAQIADIESELRAAADKTARALESEARLAGGRVENLTAALETQKREVATGNGDEVQLRALEREARSAREQLESYLGRYREAAAREGPNSTPADARVISRAAAPQLPSFPKKIPMLALAALGALIVSASIVTTRELLSGEALRRREAAPDEPAVSGATPIFARLPGEAAAEPRLGEPTTQRYGVELAQAQASVEQICDLVASGEADAAATLLLCGLCEPETTQIGLRIGRALARRGLTILVDLSGDRARFAEALEGPDGAGSGLAELLAGEASFSEVIQRDRGSRLHLMTSGAGAPWNEDDMRLALDALAATYRHLVVAATAPSAALTLSLAASAEVAILVSSSAAVDRARSEAAYAALREAGAPGLLVVDAARADSRAAAGDRDAA
ncbi:MAG: lipopolysaccharide biosynthesis protein [Methylobacteriaceae bacterium]|nr:lipopolysaccharide biosynthesis protein [Methylobacteriaceae bacterium]